MPLERLQLNSDGTSAWVKHSGELPFGMPGVGDLDQFMRSAMLLPPFCTCISLPLKLRPSIRRNFFWSNDGVNGDRSRSGPQQGDAQNRGTIM
jgi:hypothetical protein